MLSQLSYIGCLDVISFTAGAIAMVVAFVAAIGEAPRSRTLTLAAALIANVWNFILV